MTVAHPSDEALRALLAADAGEELEIEAHLENCAECRARLERLAGAVEFERDFAPHDSSPDVAALGMLQPSTEAGSLGRLDRFEVLQWIATAGTAVVWRARDTRDGSEVALKVLQPLLAAQRDYRSRFLREAAAVMRIRHESVLPVTEVVENAEPPFLVMPFLRGGSLQARLDAGQEKPLPLEQMVRIGKAVAEALGAAHELGIVHRDVKPSNILLTLEGERISAACLADFGLARAMDSMTMLTRSGSFLGTPQYMSPEQAAGAKDLDERSDLFSLGAVLYTMAAGRAPFAGDSFAELARIVQEHAPERCGALNPALPAWLENLIMRLLSKRPSDRPASAAEVLRVIEASDDLGRANTNHLVGASARLRMLVKRIALGAAAALLFSAVVLYATETTGRTSLVNAIMGAKSGRYLYIVGKWGTFDSLSDAISAADPHDVIEVRTDTPASGSGGLRMPPGKPLTLRAARGFRPTLFIPTAGWPAVGVVESALTMEGFVVAHTYRGLRAGRLLLAKGVPLKFVRCRFLRQPRPPQEMNTTGHALIALQDSPGLEMVNCEFYAPGSPLIGIVANNAGIETRITLKDSILWGAPVWCDDKAPAKLRIEVERCELVTNITFHFKQAMPAESLAILMKNSMVQSFGNVLQIPWPREQLSKTLSWQGEGNLYLVQGHLMLAQDGGAKTLDGWLTFNPGSVVETGSLYSDRIATRFQPKVFAEVSAGGTPLRVTIPPDHFPTGTRLPAVGPPAQGVGPFAD